GSYARRRARHGRPCVTLDDWFSGRTEEALEPGTVERHSEPGRRAPGSLPQRRRFLFLAPVREAASAQDGQDESLETRRAGIAGAGLPGLNGVHVDAEPPGQLTLGQTDPSPQLEDETRKARTCTVIP